MRAESQRRENSIFPSASVGTPLQVAGRYRHVRTVRKTLRSPAGPALCRIRGLCTRPSAPMMKLTLTFCPAPAGISSGSGVVSACGGLVSSHRARALTCGTSLNSAARAGVLQAWCSRSVMTLWRRRGVGTCTEALLTAGSATIRSQGQMRMRWNSPVLTGIGLLYLNHRQVGGQLVGGFKYIVIRWLRKGRSRPKVLDVNAIALVPAEGVAEADHDLLLKAIFSPRAARSAA